MNSTPRTDRAQALARTYGGDRDGWARMQDYQRMHEYTAEYPNAGSTAIASALEIPRGTVRSWLDGAKPDPAHAVDTAETRGWLDCEPGDRTFEALSLVTAWVYAGGSITVDTYVLQLSVGPEDPQAFGEQLFTELGYDTELVNADTEGRAPEIRPVGSAVSHLGRFLASVLETHTGLKSDAIRLPLWLPQSPVATQTRWAQLYAVVRGTVLDDGRLKLREERPSGYHTGLAGIFRTALNDHAAVTTGEFSLFIRPDAARFIDVVPRLPPT